MNSITNFSGQTFTVGRRVRHTDGWTGTITAIRETPMVDLLLVEPEEGAVLGRNDQERPLNAYCAAQSGRPTYCRPRDTGLSMGNYKPIA